MADETITVCIGNYGYYNEGELHDAWITLPKTDEEIRRFLAEHRLQDPMHEEIYISDYDGIPFGLDYGGIFSEYTSLDDLNLLAKQMQLNPDAVERVEAALGCGCDEPTSIISLMNWIEQADEVPYYSYSFDGMENCRSISAEEKYGYTKAERTGDYRYLEKRGLHQYFNFEEFGAADSHSGYVVLGEDGYIDTQHSMPDESYYSRDELQEQIEQAWDREHGDERDERLQDILSQPDKFRYQILSRMQSDCEYYLNAGFGNANTGNPKHLWAGDEVKQVEYMKALYNSFPGDAKPEWLSMEQIEEYGQRMQGKDARRESPVSLDAETRDMQAACGTQTHAARVARDGRDDR